MLLDRPFELPFIGVERCEEDRERRIVTLVLAEAAEEHAAARLIVPKPDVADELMGMIEIAKHSHEEIDRIGRLIELIRPLHQAWFLASHDRDLSGWKAVEMAEEPS